jgi:hypothetical protein
MDWGGGEATGCWNRESGKATQLALTMLRTLYRYPRKAYASGSRFWRLNVLGSCLGLGSGLIFRAALTIESLGQLFGPLLLIYLNFGICFCCKIGGCHPVAVSDTKLVTVFFLHPIVRSFWIYV